MGLRLPSLQHHAILAINRAMNPLLKRYLKVFLALLVVASSLWAYLWFSAAKTLEKSLSNINNDLINLSFEKLDVSGFPFKMALTIKNGKLKYSHINLDFDKLKFTTNIQLNRLNIELPSQTNMSFMFNKEMRSLSITNTKEAFIKLKDYNSFNTLNVINALKNSISPFSNFFITKLHIHANELLIKNTLNNKDMAKESLNCVFNFEKKTDIITQTDLNINFVENALNDHIAHNLDNIEVNGSVRVLSKKDKDINFIDYLIFDPLKIKVNNTVFSLNGNLEQDSADNTIFKINLGADNWMELLNTFLNQGIISEDRHQVIINIITEITGAKTTEAPINIKVQTEGNKGVRVGNTSAYRLISYFDKFISTP